MPPTGNRGHCISRNPPPPLPAPRAHKVPLCPQPPSRFGPRFRDSRRCRRILAFPEAPGGPGDLAPLADLSENTHRVRSLQTARGAGYPGDAPPPGKNPAGSSKLPLTENLRIMAQSISWEAQAVGRVLVCRSVILRLGEVKNDPRAGEGAPGCRGTTLPLRCLGRHRWTCWWLRPVPEGTAKAAGIVFR